LIEGLYRDVVFPEPPPHRPYVFNNTAATLDGKIVTGEVDEPVMDLGSPLDHATMRVLESKADTVLIGAGTLRATPKLWYAADKVRLVATKTGRFDPNVRFFTDAPGKAIVVAHPDAALPDLAAGVRVIRADLSDKPSWLGFLATLRNDFGVRVLLCEGGAELNAELLRHDLMDEVFLTLAPKAKLGANLPTMAGGAPLARAEVKRFELVSCQPVGDEVFLRYRRA